MKPESLYQALAANFPELAAYPNPVDVPSDLQLHLHHRGIAWGHQVLGYPNYDQLNRLVRQLSRGRLELERILDGLERTEQPFWRVTLEDIESSFVCQIVSGGGYDGPHCKGQTRDFSLPGAITREAIEAMDGSWHGIPSYLLLKEHDFVARIRAHDLLSALELT